MMKLLSRVFMRLSYIWFSIMVIGVVIFLLARDGVTGLDMVTLSMLIVVLLVVWQLLHARSPEEVGNVQAFEKNLKEAGRPTLVEFFSSYCVACMAVQPAVERLEREAGDRLQIIRLNVDSEPGKALLDDYNVVFTPTYIFFDADGVKRRESVGVLDQARIMYELEGA